MPQLDVLEWWCAAVPGAFLSKEDCRRREEEKMPVTSSCDVSNWGRAQSMASGYVVGVAQRGRGEGDQLLSAMTSPECAYYSDAGTRWLGAAFIESKQFHPKNPRLTAREPPVGTVTSPLAKLL